jgi:hypothetical protein
VDERLVELIVEDVLPRVLRDLKDRHKECAERYSAFWDTMPERFARKFRNKPEETMAEYLSLGEEDCDWQGADFMNRDRRLDNFIGRELAREVRKVLIQYGFYEADYWFVRWDDMEGVQALREKNQELAGMVKRLERDLARERVEKEKLYRKNQEFLEMLKQDPYKEALELKKRVEELEADLLDLQREKGVLERRLAAVEMSNRSRRFFRLCSALRVALDQGGVTPIFVAEELGVSTDLVHELFNELMDMGLLVRRYRGFYRPALELRDGGGVDLEVEVALRRVRRWAEERSSE